MKLGALVLKKNRTRLRRTIMVVQFGAPGVTHSTAALRAATGVIVDKVSI